MYRILELITSIQLGGAENVAFSIAEHCRSDNTEILVVEVFGSKGIYSNNKRAELRQKGIQTRTLSSFNRKLAILIAPVKLAILLAKEKPDLVHSHTDIPDFVLSVALRLLRYRNFKLPKICRTIHNVRLWPTHRRIGRFVEMGIMDNAVFGVSIAALQAYRGLRLSSGLSVATRCEVIYNGCEINRFATSPFSLENDKIHICYCGRLDMQKGVDYLDMHIRLIQATRPNTFAFHIIGDGPLRHMVEKMAEVVPDVFYYGPLSNASGYFYEFDALIMPSRFEGLPLVSIEASMMGVPVIATRSEGLIETLPKDWPLFFSNSDMKSLIGLLDKIASNEIDLSQAGEISGNFVNLIFSRSNMINSYRAGFNSMLQEVIGQK